MMNAIAGTLRMFSRIGWIDRHPAPNKLRRSSRSPAGAGTGIAVEAGEIGSAVAAVISGMGYQLSTIHYQLPGIVARLRQFIKKVLHFVTKRHISPHGRTARPLCLLPTVYCLLLA